MKLNHSLFLILITLFAFGCANVKTDKMASADLSEFDTYAWLPIVKAGDQVPVVNEGYNQAIMQETNNELQSRGYEIDTANPDFYVQVHAMLDEETDVQYDPLAGNYSFYGTGFGTPFYSPYYYTGYNTLTPITPYDVGTVDVVDYTQGRVVVDIVEADNNKVVWRGWLNQSMGDNPEASEIQEYLDEIFDEYPVES
jgi:hypothetical protein